MTYAQTQAAIKERDIGPEAEMLLLPLSLEEQVQGVCRNLQDVAAAFCELPSEALLAANSQDLERVRRALTGALVVLRLVEGVNKA